MRSNDPHFRAARFRLEAMTRARAHGAATFGTIRAIEMVGRG
jgi:hypothetical protein